MKNQNRTPRFLFKTEVIDIHRLERETRSLLCLGFIVAVLFHTGLATLVTMSKSKRNSISAIPVKIVIKPAKMNKPFYIKPKRFAKKPLHQYAKDLKPILKRIDTKLYSEPETYIDAFEIDISYNIDTQKISDILPDSIFYDTGTSLFKKEPIPLKNQLFFDNGHHKMEIVIPPGNKKAIQGYIRFAVVLPEFLTSSETLKNATTNLCSAMNRYTNIYAQADRQISMSSSKIYKYPFLFISSDTAFILTEHEKWNLGKYLATGGFIIIDNAKGNSWTDIAMREMISSIFDILSQPLTDNNNPYYAVAGADYRIQSRIEPFQINHDLYHSFFDFDTVRPRNHNDNANSTNTVEGIFIRENCVVLYINGYTQAWEDKRNENHLKMGVNMIVYALNHVRGQYIVQRPNKREFYDHEVFAGLSPMGAVFKPARVLRTQKTETGLLQGKWKYFTDNPIKRW